MVGGVGGGGLWGLGCGVSKISCGLGFLQVWLWFWDDQ